MNKNQDQPELAPEKEEGFDVEVKIEPDSSSGNLRPVISAPPSRERLEEIAEDLNNQFWNHKRYLTPVGTKTLILAALQEALSLPPQQEAGEREPVDDLKAVLQKARELVTFLSDIPWLHRPDCNHCSLEDDREPCSCGMRVIYQRKEELCERLLSRNRDGSLTTEASSPNPAPPLPQKEGEE